MRLALGVWLAVIIFPGCGDSSSPRIGAAVDAASTMRDDAATNLDLPMTSIDGPVLPPDLPAARDAMAPDTSGGETPAPDGAACDGWTTLKRLSPAEASTLITTNDPIVINVHYPYEGDIPGTDATIPFDDVDAIETYLRHDHCAEVLLVCRSGSMSENAGNALVRRGYLRVRDLKGGMVAWEAAGYPLLKDGGP